ncbi:MAG: ATP-binding cassette domain-containing protein [Nocardioidaceae bacterium]
MIQQNQIALIDPAVGRVDADHRHRAAHHRARACSATASRAPPPASTANGMTNERRPQRGPVVAPAAVERPDLQIETSSGQVPVVTDVSFEIAPGEVLGVVGESGSGKTTVGLALLGHARRGAAHRRAVRCSGR